MSASKQFHPLGRLIREVQQANGWSYADISANAQRAGRSLSRSRVESLRNDELTSIGIKAIESLAAGLSVSADRVAAAAFETMGYAPEPAASMVSPAEALQSDPLLSAPMRRVLLAALGTAHDEFHQPSGAMPPERQTPPTKALRANTLRDVAADDG